MCNEEWIKLHPDAVTQEQDKIALELVCKDFIAGHSPTPGYRPALSVSSVVAELMAGLKN